MARVKSALKAVPGAQQVSVSLKKKEARVVYDKRQTTAAVLVQAVNDAGFDARERRDAL